MMKMVINYDFGGDYDGDDGNYDGGGDYGKCDGDK